MIEVAPVAGIGVGKVRQRVDDIDADRGNVIFPNFAQHSARIADIGRLCGRACDANHDHRLMFSDMLTDGIVRQFPAKFSTAAGVPVRSPTARG